MNSGKLLRATALYGAGDVVVLAVGGLVLLPLYTRTLSQAEFGIYVIVKTNAEIFSYLLYFGLPSAAARLYFQYRDVDRQVDYLRSIVVCYCVILLATAAVFGVWGNLVWRLLSPTVPARPYLWFCLAIAGLGFFSTLGPLWLRLEGRARAFSILQVCSALLLATLAGVNLVLLKLRLPGLFAAMIASSVLSAAVLARLFGRRFAIRLEVAHIRESLHFALPIVVGYVAYFVLNRSSTVMLQRYLPVTQVAVFGLAQQLAMIITVAATAFGKAFQPAVYGAERSQAHRLVEEAGKAFMLLMLCITGVVLLFGSEMLSLVAPGNYAPGSGILGLLVLSGFLYSFGVISDTTLMYARKPKTSVAVSIVGAGVALLLSALWIPSLQLRGAALAIVTAYAVKALIGHALFKRITGRTYLRFMLASSLAAFTIAGFAAWLARAGLPAPASVCIKSAVAVALLLVIYRIYMTGVGFGPEVAIGQGSE